VAEQKNGGALTQPKPIPDGVFKENEQLCDGEGNAESTACIRKKQER